MTDTPTDFEEGLAGLVEPEKTGDSVDSNTTTLSPERNEDDGPVKPVVDIDLNAEVDINANSERLKWPFIMIDEQEGKNNYETVTVNGKCYQIMRGVETQVPPAVLHVLENAIASRMIQFQNPTSGMTEHKMVDYPSIPYRVTRFAQG